MERRHNKEMARTLIASTDTRARTMGVLLAVALGYAAAHIAGKPSSTSAAIGVLSVLALAVLATVYGVRRVLLTVAIIGIPFQWDKNFFYDYQLSSHGAIGGVSLSITTLALIGLYGLWGADFLLNPNHADRPRLRWAFTPFTYFAIAALSITAASNPSLSLNELALIAQCLLLFVYVSSTVKSIEQLHEVIFLLLLSLTLQAAFLVLQYYTGASIHFRGLSSRERIEETTRVAGTLGSPNSAGGFLACCIAIAVALLVGRGVRSSRVLPMIGVCLGAFALVLTFSRGGWLAVTIAVTLLLWFFTIRGELTWKIVILGALVAALGFFMGDQIHSRLQSQAGGLKARVSVGEVALDVIRDHPLAGVGVNNYATVLPDYTPLTQWTFVPHNKFLLVWSETGIVGLITFILFLLATTHRGWIALREADEPLLPYAAALTAAFLALLVHMNFEPFHGRLQLMLLFLIAGLLHAVAHIAVGRARLANGRASTTHKPHPRQFSVATGKETLPRASI
jgi:putative inorganic carbon (hco3(-)) transporter